MESSVADVLVVEDDELVRMAMARLLMDVGYRVITAEDPPEAIAWLEAGSFRLVISDLNFRGRGSAKSLALVAQANGIPFIVASGANRLRKLCAKWSVAAVLLKPFAGEDLLAAVARSLMPVRRAVGQSSSWDETTASSPSSERSSAFEWTPSLA